MESHPLVAPHLPGQRQPLPGGQSVRVPGWPPLKLPRQEGPCLGNKKPPAPSLWPGGLDPWGLLRRTSSARLRRGETKPETRQSPHGWQVLIGAIRQPFPKATEAAASIISLRLEFLWLCV